MRIAQWWSDTENREKEGNEKAVRFTVRSKGIHQEDDKEN
jgi:hypothetical protein